MEPCGKRQSLPESTTPWLSGEVIGAVLSRKRWSSLKCGGTKPAETTYRASQRGASPVPECTEQDFKFQTNAGPGKSLEGEGLPHLDPRHSEDNSKGLHLVVKRLGDGHFPSPTTTIKEVPQGSVLGPIVEVGPTYAKPHHSVLGNFISAGTR